MTKRFVVTVALSILFSMNAALAAENSTAIDKKFSACISTSAQKGNYSSFDGGKSTQAILEKDCTSEYLAWVESCVNAKAGNTQNGCVLKAAIAAQTALKMHNK